ALALGLDCRIVTGTRSGWNHAWNIVRIGDLWYHVDAACGAQLLDPSGYFLKPLFGGYEIVYGDFTAPDIAGYTFVGQNERYITGTLNYFISYTIDTQTAELTVSGTGDTPDYNHSPFISVFPGLYSVTLTEGITRIGSKMFYASGITEITLPRSVVSIGDYAFYSCQRLTSLNIPEGVTEIGRSVITNCFSLASITADAANPVFHAENNCLINTAEKTVVLGLDAEDIPSDGSVTAIGDYAFEGTGLPAEYAVPEHITSIGVRAFAGCTGLEELVIPETVTDFKTSSDVRSGAFAGCRSLEAVDIRTAEIGWGTFQDCTALSRISLPDGLRELRSGVFKNLTALTEISLPDGLEAIYDSAFDGCSALREITIPASTTSIGCLVKTSNVSEPQIFYGSVNPLGSSPFTGCTSLERITVAEGNEVYRSDEAGALIENGHLSTTYPYDRISGDMLVQYPAGRADESYTVPDGVTVIGNRAFKDSASLKNVVLPEGLSEIRLCAFQDCTGLERVYIPSSVEDKKIDSMAFSGCEDLTVFGQPGSFAETFAAKEGFPFVPACAATGNFHETVSFAASEPTCTEPGYTAGERCSLCGEWISGHERTADPLGHLPGEPAMENVVTASCTEEGSYDLVVRCERCGGIISSSAERLAKTDHTDSDHDSFCDECGGFICPHEQTRVENAVPASCTVNGYTGDTVCAVCGTVLEYGATVFAPG
ncbi:MAG: leucine-rich repeat protein, partial [Clostridia bacterium]|nr:leucine-rich repeat protein [Clostridia bacterium]